MTQDDAQSSSLPRPTRIGPSGRLLAFYGLERWEKGTESLEHCLDQVLSAGPVEARERALAHELTYGVVRHLGRLDDLLAILLKGPLHKQHPSVLLMLRLGLYQLRSSRAPTRAVVHEQVELTRQVGCPWASGLVNGVLRRYDRERETLEATRQGPDLESMARRTAHPPWLVRAMNDVVKLDPACKPLSAWLESNNQVPPLTLRANRPRITRDGLLELLRPALESTGGQVTPCLYSPDGLRVEGGGNPERLPGFQEGYFGIQDEASQLVVNLLQAQPGERILDACAAPGGKTCAIASDMTPAAGANTGYEGTLVATDVSVERLGTLAQGFSRLLSRTPETLVHDWTSPEVPDILRRPFDRALVDAPCSGFGVLRRIPEIKWRRTMEDLPRFSERQLQILEQVAARIRPGGTLVYSVCTPLLAEGPRLVEMFLTRNCEWQRVDLSSVLPIHAHGLVTPEGDLRTVPHRDGCDAFFASRLSRRSE